MIKNTISIIFGCLFSCMVVAGVKVTSLDLKTDGPKGIFLINLEGRASELPDIKVLGKTIELTINGAENFNSISKNVKGAYLSANVLNGKIISKLTLPYDVKSNEVSLGWNKNSIEVNFTRPSSLIQKPLIINNPQTASAVKVENSFKKESLDESYLKKLIEEDVNQSENAKNKIVQDSNNLKDEVHLKQSAIVESTQVLEATNKNPSGEFSFAGYTAKFSFFLGLVLALFYGVVQVFKRGIFKRGKLGFLNNEQMIQVLSTTYLAPKRSLMIVKAHKQIFLVANSENGIHFLSEMNDTSGLIKEGEKIVTGNNFDLSLNQAQDLTNEDSFKIKENINESTPVAEKKGIQSLSPKDIARFSDELKKKAKKLKPIEFN